MTILSEKNIIIENKDLLTEFFFKGIKKEQNIGLEFEKITVDKKNHRSVGFFFKNGILDFLFNMQKTGRFLPDYENDILLSLISADYNITLEPGCQVEASLKPLKNISDIEQILDRYNDTSSKIANLLGIEFLALGIQPVSTFEKIKLLPKSRYGFMTRYFEQTEALPYVMMRETAGIQTSIDYSSENDAIRKLSTALKLSPFLSAMFCNSPVRNGKLSGYKSFRANAWLHTDNKRCGLISKKLFEKNTDFGFADYTDKLLDVPAIFKDDKYFGNTTFRELLKDKSNNINMHDWERHISLFFTDVRLKNYIEIRNHDCQKKEFALAIPALYKGIFYSQNGIEKINDLMKNFVYYDFEFVRHNAPKFGINFKVKGYSVADILTDIFSIAVEGLKEFKSGEEKYLEAVTELLNNKMTPADIIIKNFQGSWKGNIDKLVEYSRI